MLLLALAFRDSVITRIPKKTGLPGRAGEGLAESCRSIQNASDEIGLRSLILIGEAQGDIRR